MLPLAPLLARARAFDQLAITHIDSVINFAVEGLFFVSVLIYQNKHEQLEDKKACVQYIYKLYFYVTVYQMHNE